MNTEEAPALQATNIHQSFGPVEALRGVNLTLMPGEIVAILGVNGAGKSTFLDIVLGLATPTSGEISVYGMSPREAVRRSLIGAMLQTGSMPRDGKVGYTIDLVASMHANPIPTDELLERTKLTKLAKRPIDKLSGGERQRVRLALALAGNPDFLILDEPTAGMDALARRAFWETMRSEAAPSSSPRTTSPRHARTQTESSSSMRDACSSTHRPSKSSPTTKTLKTFSSASPPTRTQSKPRPRTQIHHTKKAS